MFNEPAEVAEVIEMPFWMWPWEGPRKHVLDMAVHLVELVHLANATELSMCGGDAACCKLL